jgi:hypothetical protein
MVNRTQVSCFYFDPATGYQAGRVASALLPPAERIDKTKPVDAGFIQPSHSDDPGRSFPNAGIG